MKLSTQTIEWLIDRKDRLWTQQQLSKFIWCTTYPKTETILLWVIKHLLFTGAYETIGKHYKLKDENILYKFIKK